MSRPIKSKGFICIASIFFVLLLACTAAHAQSEPRLSKGQTIYVPLYSHIYFGDKETPIYLAATLSIRNTDQNSPITVLAADYYDSNGKLLKRFVEKPLSLDRLVSIRFVVKESDAAGGSGANFIVKWTSDKPVNSPIAESIMIGTKYQRGISFTSRGQVIKEEK